MDRIAEMKDTDIPVIVFPTIGHFIPLLEEKRAEITKISRRTFKYGSTDRHKLDIYYPSASTESSATETKAAATSAPVLFFVYGGGFTSGARILPAPADLGYANLGAYFAQRGFVTVIPDYRLSPEVTFPAPAEDVRDAVEWVTRHPQNLRYGGSGDTHSGDINKIFVMGHSAGAVNVATMLLLSLLSEDVRPRIKAAVLMSGAYSFDIEAVGPTINPDVAKAFFGSLERAKANAPLSLLSGFPEEKISTEIPPILMVESERDPEPFLRAGEQFQEALRTRTGREVKKIVARGHNHISINWALMTGQGEQWAEEVVAWLQGFWQ